MSDKRVFEQGGKFWEIWREGTVVYTRTGKIGSGGQTRLKDERSEDAAVGAIDKQIREKREKGFVERDAGPIVTRASPLDKTELAAKLATLVDEPSYLVFADWLQAQGHPWGELIAVQCGIPHASDAAVRRELERAADRLVAEHGRAIVGDAIANEHSHFTWQRGFLRTATIGTSTEPVEMVAAVKALLALPAAHAIDGVVVHPIPARFKTHRDWQQSDRNVVDPWKDLDALAAAIPERVTHVGFGGWPAPAASAYVRMPSFRAISAAFPRTTKLELTGWPNVESGRLAMPALTDLEIRFGSASPEALDAIAASKLTTLERLSVWLGGETNCILDDVYPPDYDADESEDRYPTHYPASDLESLEVYDCTTEVPADAVGAFIDALPITIKHLGIQSACLTEDMVSAIVTRKLILSLETLDLSGGTLDDTAAKALLSATAKTQLGKLKTLDLRSNQLSATGAKKVTAALPSALVTGQRKAGAPELFLRYVAVME